VRVLEQKDVTGLASHHSPVRGLALNFAAQHNLELPPGRGMEVTHGSFGRDYEDEAGCGSWAGNEDCWRRWGIVRQLELSIDLFSVGLPLRTENTRQYLFFMAQTSLLNERRSTFRQHESSARVCSAGRPTS